MPPNKELKLIVDKFDVAQCTSIDSIDQGLINETFIVETAKDKYILQKLHKIFPIAVTENMKAVTEYLNQHNKTTPLLIHTNEGNIIFEHNNFLWRMMTFIEGESFDTIPNVEYAKEAGILVGEFHKLLDGLNYNFKHKFENWHDTDFHMNSLRETAKHYEKTEKGGQLSSLKNKILSSYDLLEKVDFSNNGIVHGDLKINNIRFAKDNNKALCLIDLDTLQRGDIVAELGDASRSWCNKGEGKPKTLINFDLDLFQAMMAGYILGNNGLTDLNKLLKVPDSTSQIALELSSRFLKDAYTESYFKLDKNNYATLFEQNFMEATRQFELSQDINRKKEEAVEIIKKLIT